MQPIRIDDLPLDRGCVAAGGYWWRLIREYQSGLVHRDAGSARTMVIATTPPLTAIR